MRKLTAWVSSSGVLKSCLHVCASQSIAFEARKVAIVLFFWADDWKIFNVQGSQGWVRRRGMGASGMP